MFRMLFSLLLIAHLVACPVRCLSCDAAGSSAEATVGLSCSCCADQDAASNGNLTASWAADEQSCPSGIPGQECQCKSCICEGAILLGGFELPDPSCQLMLLTASLLPKNDSANARRVHDRPLAPAASRYWCGRQVRIAHQSWLI